MLLHPPLPPHSIFHLDSQYVIDFLLGLPLPCSNIELAILLLDFYHHLASRTYVELRKVKSHTGIPGNDRADLNASKGITSCTPIGRFATFPPLVLPVLPRLDTPSSAPDSLKIVQTITSSYDECFPPKPPIARKPYISSDTISLIAQLPHTSSTDLKPFRNKIKKS